MACFAGRVGHTPETADLRPPEAMPPGASSGRASAHRGKIGLAAMRRLPISEHGNEPTAQTRDRPRSVREYTTLKAAMARSAIRRALLKGGTAHVTVGNEKRMIFHEPMMHAPMKKRAWPFSLTQMHDVELTVSDLQGVKLRPNKRFSRRQIDLAVLEFLSDSDPAAEVLVQLRKPAAEF